MAEQLDSDEGDFDYCSEGDDDVFEAAILNDVEGSALETMVRLVGK